MTNLLLQTEKNPKPSIRFLMKREVIKYNEIKNFLTRFLNSNFQLILYCPDIGADLLSTWLI